MSSNGCRECGYEVLSFRERLNGICDRCRVRVYDSMCPGTPKAKPAPAQPAPNDPVQHPAHYTGHKSGIECIQVTRFMSFTLGNAVKYLWRAGLKSPDAIEDLRKAVWYIEREIENLIEQKASK